MYKGNSRLQLVVKEEIRAVQYDRKEVADVWEIYGSVQCKVSWHQVSFFCCDHVDTLINGDIWFYLSHSSQAELEGHPDILLTLVTAPGSPPLDHLITHSCVQSADVAAASPTSSTDQGNRKIRFSAPNETFSLCKYQISTVPVLPIRGFYQMKVCMGSNHCGWCNVMSWFTCRERRQFRFLYNLNSVKWSRIILTTVKSTFPSSTGSLFCAELIWSDLCYCVY